MIENDPIFKYLKHFNNDIPWQISDKSYKIATSLIHLQTLFETPLKVINEVLYKQGYIYFY